MFKLSKKKCGLRSSSTLPMKNGNVRAALLCSFNFSNMFGTLTSTTAVGNSIIQQNLFPNIEWEVMETVYLDHLVTVYQDHKITIDKCVQ